MTAPPPSAHNRISPTPSSCFSLSSPIAKNIPLPFPAKSLAYVGHPAPEEGRWPSSRTLGRGAVDAARVVAHGIAGRALLVSGRRRGTNGASAYGEAVWSWHPLLVSNRRRRCEPNRASRYLQSADDGDKRNSSLGRARSKSSNHRAGKAGRVPVNQW